ncbi:MAG: hypothetical protein U0637_15075 [Phycisphaerales bacterium]
MKTICAVGLSALCLSAPAWAGPDWVEVSDAGSTLASAQAVVGIGTPQRISGSLSAGRGLQDLEDLYLIRIEQPSTFSFTMTGSEFDSQLYLFNVTLADQLFGLLSNNNLNNLTSEASIFQSTATDGTGAEVLMPGVYCLGITGAGRYPVGRNGAIFNQVTPTELSGPDGPSGINPLTGWAGDGASGSYEVVLVGAGYVNVPAPASALVLGCVGVSVLRRRR